MTEVRCAKCCKITEVDDEDLWSGNLEDVADDYLIYRFTHYCENEIVDEDDPENWEECGHTIEVLRYAKLQDHRDIEQELE
tara:strand:- start:663 stop:905 length:243 start_codon:yes stop_codon:yes gene_type:complete